MSSSKQKPSRIAFERAGYSARKQAQEQAEVSNDAVQAYARKLAELFVFSDVLNPGHKFYSNQEWQERFWIQALLGLAELEIDQNITRENATLLACSRETFLLWAWNLATQKKDSTKLLMIEVALAKFDIEIPV